MSRAVKTGDHGSAENDYSYQEYHSVLTEKAPRRFAPAVSEPKVNKAVEEFMADGYRVGYGCEPPNPRPSVPRRIVYGFARRWRRLFGAKANG